MYNDHIFYAENMQNIFFEAIYNLMRVMFRRKFSLHGPSGNSSSFCCKSPKAGIKMIRHHVSSNLRMANLLSLIGFVSLPRPLLRPLLIALRRIVDHPGSAVFKLKGHVQKIFHGFMDAFLFILLHIKQQEAAAASA